MSDQRLRDAIRVGIAQGMGISESLAELDSPDGYDASILLDSVVEHVEAWASSRPEPEVRFIVDKVKVRDVDDLPWKKDKR